jgi:hypothetical protein
MFVNFCRLFINGSRIEELSFSSLFRISFPMMRLACVLSFVDAQQQLFLAPAPYAELVAAKPYSPGNTRQHPPMAAAAPMPYVVASAADITGFDGDGSSPFASLIVGAATGVGLAMLASTGPLRSKVVA